MPSRPRDYSACRRWKPKPSERVRVAVNVSYWSGESNDVRVQVLTNAGALDRGKQLAVVSQFTSMVADAAGDPELAHRTWVLLTEAVPGGWGLGGHANTNDELVAAARNQIAELQAKAGGCT